MFSVLKLSIHNSVFAPGSRNVRAKFGAKYSGTVRLEATANNACPDCGHAHSVLVAVDRGQG